MNKSKSVVQLLACGMCALAVAPSALAKAERGLYLGLSVGKSSFDIDKAELDGLVLSSFSSLGVPVLSRTSTYEDSDTSLAFLMGYRFLPYVAVEASYIDLGTTEYRLSGMVNPPGPITSATATTNMDIQTKGFTISGIGSLPVGEVVDLHARLGILISRTEASANATIGSSPSSSSSDSTDSASALVGVGAAFHLGEHWSLSLDWTRYVNVGDANEDDDFETQEGFDIDATSFGATYKF